MATWPDLTDYHEALQSPQRSLGDPDLQKAQIDKDRFGMPKPATGGNAVVYKATEGENVWAVRCFLRPISDHAERYAAISKHLSKNRSAHSTEFVYLADGLRIKGGTFPIVKMAWVQGPNLDRCVEGLLDKPRELAALRERFRTLVKDIERAKFAHGDLQHGNILVAGKDLSTVRLSDYPKPIRQLVVRGLGREVPTVLITNHTTATPKFLIERYARRMTIEQRLAEAIRSFHLDSLCSQVPLAVDFDVALTVLADIIYRRFARGLHTAYRNQTPDTLRAQLIDGIGELRFTPGHIEVALRRRTHTPALLEAGYEQHRIEVPWWDGRTLSYTFPAR